MFSWYPFDVSSRESLLYPILYGLKHVQPFLPKCLVIFDATSDGNASFGQEFNRLQIYVIRVLMCN